MSTLPGSHSNVLWVFFPLSFWCTLKQDALITVMFEFTAKAFFVIVIYKAVAHWMFDLDVLPDPWHSLPTCCSHVGRGEIKIHFYLAILLQTIGMDRVS